MTLSKFPRKLLAELSILSDEQLLSNLPRLLVTYLDVDLAYIGLLDKTGSTVDLPYLHTRNCLERRLAGMVGRYSLEGTACAQTLKRGNYALAGEYHFTVEPSSLLESDVFEGYAGVSLIDSFGSATGVLALLSCHPLICTSELLTSLEQIANRVSVVVENRRASVDACRDVAR